ncbi:NnrS family protein [Mobilicoccus massiliensis]|uniref:NnrS family protein n=1 Tax=Mobilicoccus massiliensis TaxID=1522310 RepID=UPI0009E18E5B|nr:NnrS family protein [Mobilicoccus massiliensis]
MTTPPPAGPPTTPGTPAGQGTPSTWPARGPWAASYRVLFALLAAWAALVVPLWYAFGSLDPSPLGWHIHEMVFGIGGGALAGYLPTACTSWTGRPPVSGRPVVVLAALWVLARAVMLAPDVSPWLIAPAVGAVFWWIAVLVGREIARCGRPLSQIGAYPVSLVVFCVVAGVASARLAVAVRTGAPLAALSDLVVLLFTLLLTGVGGRMVPAFLNTAAERHDIEPIPVDARMRRVVLAAIVVAGLTTPWRTVSAVAGLVAAVLLLVHMARWPLRAVRYDALATMTLVAFAWLPVGLAWWGLGRLGALGTTATTLSHTLTIGALSGLVVAVMSRAPARRGAGRLHVRVPALAGFVAIMVSAGFRLADLDAVSAGWWCLGWALVFVAHLPAFTDPMPRPIFSARRLPRTP